MKTILYQPLFINPQAYFVFPQLYHIEKGDSYIEPANITGQLIINDLTKSLTSTPILNKESIVAWYSPYCKQKLTNYDVIEAYVEDFTKWAYRNYRGTVKITNNTIVITNVVETNNIVEDDNKPYSDLTIHVTGVTENKYLIVRQGRGKPETYIKKDGVYTFDDSRSFIGCHGDILIFNRTLTEYELSWVKNNMMCSKQQEPDIDL